MRRAAWAGAAALWTWGVAGARAQAHNPFGVGISEGGGYATGVTGWIIQQQVVFEHGLSAAVRAAKADGSALPWLVALSFAYGVFHAAGPGHGKVVMTSYMVAGNRALRRGLVLTLLAALLQGVVAIVLVGVLALLLHVTATRMKDAATAVETASFAGVALLGAWLTARRGVQFARALRGPRLRFAHPAAARTGPGALAFAGGPLATGCGCGPGLRFTGATPARDPSCGHFHGPDPSSLGDDFSWAEAALTVAAAGTRPCSGAILVLVFALAQGLFGAGVLSVLAMSLGTALTTGAIAALAVLARGTALKLSAPGTWGGAVLIRGLELAAALLILVAGVSLFLGTASLGGA